MKTILLYDSQPVFVAGLSYLIRKSHPEVKIYEAGSMSDLNHLLARDVATTAVVGIRSYAEGIEVFREIPKKMVVQVIYDNFTDVIKLKATIGTIGGLIERKTGTEELLKCFDAFLLEGKGYCAVTVNHLLQKFSKPESIREAEGVKPTVSPFSFRLTRRETEIKDLLVKGKRITDIADALQLKPSTVSTIKRKLFKKMEVTNLIQLVHRAASV
ncbi:hypothetical protein GCM10023091_08830 [Ravibacter arvi]|uniref:HTH luxR-type domain-containing protein n=1 Tax=Ravibacter arvi TaxID=2051041 RepID=A0ABP8LTM3_9BACT